MMVRSLVAATVMMWPVAALAASDEQSWFFLPGAEDFRLQVIERLPGETAWPFTVDRGYLLCVFSVGQRQVMFATIPVENADEEIPVPRIVMISSNPFEIIFANLANRDLLVQQADPAALVRTFAPLNSAGKRLCDQPRGEVLGPGEL